MYDESSQAFPPEEPATPRKPRIALMGEFSAGKSSLTNLLIGDSRIPMRVTATQLPPVWLHYGTDAPYREDLNGEHYPIDGHSIEGIPVRDTAFIHLFVEAEVLEVCDVIDTPGISDPNMPPEVWQRAAEEADGVLWLTHATQAWRQSEAAAWGEMPEELRPLSLLLVTRIDKILNVTDRSRVLARVRKEAGPMFRDILPISVTQALEAGDDDADLWEASGGEAFSQALLRLITDLERHIRLSKPRPARRRVAAPEPEPEAEPETGHEPAVRLRIVHSEQDRDPDAVRVALPRRVALEGVAAVRPRRPIG